MFDVHLCLYLRINLQGRLKVVQEQFNSDGIEPTPEYDGHISKSFQRGKKMNFGDMYDSSQVKRLIVGNKWMLSGSGSL